MSYRVFPAQIPYTLYNIKGYKDLKVLKAADIAKLRKLGKLQEIKTNVEQAWNENKKRFLR